MFDITKPLVTVYITNYNYGKYIKTAIDSVLRQTFTGFELIIIDDGSTDNSRQIILEYEQHATVRIIFQENKGLNRSCNVALNASRGKYIMRLDADDYLDPQALLVLTNLMESNSELGLVFPDYHIVDEGGNIISQMKRHDFNGEVSLLDQPAHGACTLIRKRCLLGVGGYSDAFRCQDGYDLWLKFSKHTSLVTTNALASCFRIVPGQLSEDRVTYMKEVEEILPRKGLLPVMAKFFSRAEKRIHLTFFKSLIFYLLFQNIQHTYVVVRKNGSLEKITGPYHTIFKMDKIAHT